MNKITKIIYIVVGAAMAGVFMWAAATYLFGGEIAKQGNYLFICGQSALFMAVNFVPFILAKLKIKVPDFVYIIFIIFCLAHFLLGEILGFFALISWWDSALHTVSGILITIIAFSFITILNKSQSTISLPLAIVSAFCITVSIGVVWEIVEFLMDSWFGLNMQRAYISDPSGERGIALVGSEALLDTMKDLILDALGALIVCVGVVIYTNKKKVGVDKLVFITKIEKNK